MQSDASHSAPLHPTTPSPNALGFPSCPPPMSGPSSGHPHHAFLGIPHILRAPSPFIRSLPIPRLANHPAAADGDGGGGDGPIGPDLPLATLQPAPSMPVQVQAVVLGPTRMGRKMGRPRKYLPALTLPSGSTSGSGVGLGSGSISPAQRKRRGRPPGSGRKLRLASPVAGQWVTSSPGRGFTLHVIKIGGGQDIMMKIISFAQQGPRAICIMSASGVVSTVTLRQPATSGGTATYEGHYDIICLSGSYLLSDVSKSDNRAGGLNVCLSSPEGHVLGGCVVGLLKAAGPVQVIVGTFIHDNIKEEKKKAKAYQDELEFAAGDNTSTQSSTVSVQNLTPPVWEWPGPMLMELNSRQWC